MEEFLNFRLWPRLCENSLQKFSVVSSARIYHFFASKVVNARKYLNHL